MGVLSETGQFGAQREKVMIKSSSEVCAWLRKKTPGVNVRACISPAVTRARLRPGPSPLKFRRCGARPGRRLRPAAGGAAAPCRAAPGGAAGAGGTEGGPGAGTKPGAAARDTARLPPPRTTSPQMSPLPEGKGGGPRRGRGGERGRRRAGRAPGGLRQPRSGVAAALAQRRPGAGAQGPGGGRGGARAAARGAVWRSRRAEAATEVSERREEAPARVGLTPAPGPRSPRRARSGCLGRRAEPGVCAAEGGGHRACGAAPGEPEAEEGLGRSPAARGVSQREVVALPSGSRAVLARRCPGWQGAGLKRSSG